MRANTERLQQLAATSQAHLASENPTAAVVVASEPLTLTNPGQVTLQPIAAKPALFTAPVEMEGLSAPMTADVMPPARDFIPPAPEPVLRAPRMPRPDEMPMPAQRVMAQPPAQSQSNPQASGEKRRASLLEKLASVGIGARKAAEDAAHTEPQLAPPMQAPVRAPAPAAAPEARRPVGGAPAAPRRENAPSLDVNGRPSPVQRASLDDEHLDIPAFLRRQAH